MVLSGPGVVAVGPSSGLDERARRIAQPGPPHPLGQGLPQNVGQKADQDVGQHTLFSLMPDRADFQLVLGDAEGPLRLGELDVPFPLGGGIKVSQVGAKQVAALGNRPPIAPA